MVLKNNSFFAILLILKFWLNYAKFEYIHRVRQNKCIFTYFTQAIKKNARQKLNFFFTKKKEEKR